MNSSLISRKSSVGLALHPFAILLISASLFGSPAPASASSTSEICRPLACPAMSLTNDVFASVSAHPDHKSLIDLYRQHAEGVMATVKIEIDQQRTSIEATLDQTHASAMQIAQQSPQETGTKNSVALCRLKEDTRSLKAQVSRQARASRGRWHADIKSAMTQASDALEKVEGQHCEPASQKAKHSKEVRRLLHKHRQETLPLLEKTWKDSSQQMRTRIAKMIKSLDKAIAEEQAKERGPIIGFEIIHHKGHQHREFIYANDPPKKR